MQIRCAIRVRCTNVSPSPETPKREGPATHGRQSGRCTGQGRPRSDACGAPRVHPHAGGRGARSEPLDVRPSHPAADRDGRDAVGNETHPCRRARATDRRTAAAGTRAGTVGQTRAAAGPLAGPRRPHPSRARGRKDTPPNRDRSQRSRHPDGTWRDAMVALDRPVDLATCPPLTARVTVES